MHYMYIIYIIYLEYSKYEPELVPSVERFLLDGEYDWTQVFVVSKVVPMFCPVKILFVGLLFDK